MKLDPRTKKLVVFLTTRLPVLIGIGYVLIRFSGISDPVWLLGLLTLSVAVWRGGLSIYRRLILPARHPRSYGKWAIVTGTTSGIGKEFSQHLASLGMNVLLISRSVDKLKEQQEDLKTRFPDVEIRYLCYDFTKVGGPEQQSFYIQLQDFLREVHNNEQLQTNGDKKSFVETGVGILVNNVGTANEAPRSLEEMSDEEVGGIINCNIQSLVGMTRAVLPWMKARKSGCVLSISSGSGLAPGPFIAIYSATKAFMTQFSRSMTIECWGSGVDFYVSTPLYVVSNLYKRKYGTLIAPLPIVVVTGSLAQLGKKYLWQGHGYWFHGVLGNFYLHYWNAMDAYRATMIDNRKRYDARMAAKAAENKQE